MGLICMKIALAEPVLVIRMSIIRLGTTLRKCLRGVLRRLSLSTASWGPMDKSLHLFSCTWLFRMAIQAIISIYKHQITISVWMISMIYLRITLVGSTKSQVIVYMTIQGMALHPESRPLLKSEHLTMALKMLSVRSSEHLCGITLFLCLAQITAVQPMVVTTI